nr:retrovirus-related Pol polyprotein from transposon TNT 1-94 [Tanacetum cinerariifolium]
MKALLEQQGEDRSGDLKRVRDFIHDESEDIDEFHKLVGDLGAIDTAISDEDQALSLLTSFPSSYDNFVETLLYDRDTLKLEDVLAKLNSRELHKMTEAKGDGGEGLYVKERSRQRDMEYNNKKSQGFVRNEDHVSGSRDDAYDSANVMMAMRNAVYGGTCKVQPPPAASGHHRRRRKTFSASPKNIPLLQIYKIYHTTLTTRRPHSSAATGTLCTTPPQPPPLHTHAATTTPPTPQLTPPPRHYHRSPTVAASSPPMNTTIVSTYNTTTATNATTTATTTSDAFGLAVKTARVRLGLTPAEGAFGFAYNRQRANMVPVVVLEVWWWQRGCEVAAAVVGWCRGWR